MFFPPFACLVFSAAVSAAPPAVTPADSTIGADTTLLPLTVDVLRPYGDLLQSRSARARVRANQGTIVLVRGRCRRCGARASRYSEDPGRQKLREISGGRSRSQASQPHGRAVRAVPALIVPGQIDTATDVVRIATKHSRCSSTSVQNLEKCRVSTSPSTGVRCVDGLRNAIPSSTIHRSWPAWLPQFAARQWLNAPNSVYHTTFWRWPRGVRGLFYGLVV